MTESVIAVVAISTLVSGALWLSMRMAAGANLAVLPAHSRRRVQWWRLNAHHVYLGCAGLALATVALQVSQFAH
jgi:hypothetical protein